MQGSSSRLLPRLLTVVGTSGLAVAGVGLVRAAVPDERAAPAPSATGPYERLPVGTLPPPPATASACYLAGVRTAPRPCLDRLDPLLPRLIGQCERSATHIESGPVEAQYTNSPAALCCYRATQPTCSGRPLRLAGEVRRAAARARGDWG